MKSIKPGRGPSAMNAMGSVFAVIFGIFWIGMAVSMGAPIFFPLFGIIFVIAGIVQAIYHFKNFSGKNRFSAFDITDGNEERDPIEEILHRDDNADYKSTDNAQSDEVKFCPYCGTSLSSDFEYCPKCGKRLPC